MTARAATSAFGVVIPARPEHLHWVRGACASVQRFMPGTPICVLLDGGRPPRDLQRADGVSFLLTDDVEPAELRDVSCRSPRAKNLALWASPYETFLLLDADTVVWGDMRELADFDRYDFIVDRPGVEPLKAVMDTDRTAECFPGFDARRHARSYVNNGVYFARRGALELDRYLHALRVAREHPGLFYGSQGSFNYMLFRAADEGSVRLRQRELQVQVGRTDRADVVRRFSLDESGPVVTGDPVVLHWVASTKPRVRERNGDYFAPMTYFRLEFRQTATRAGGPRAAAGLTWLRFEDMACADFRGSNLRGRVARLRRRGRKRYASLRVWLYRRRVTRLMAAMLRAG